MYGLTVVLNVMEFIWSDEKSIANLSKHGVSFEQARKVFNDPFAIEFVDDRFEYGETRYVLIGLSDDLLLVVVHAE